MRGIARLARQTAERVAPIDDLSTVTFVWPADWAAPEHPYREGPITWRRAGDEREPLPLARAVRLYGEAAILGGPDPAA